MTPGRPPSRARDAAATAVRRVAMLLWRLVALVALALGLIGVAVPGLPTVPFILLAAWAAGHGWPALERRLERHPRFGPPLRRWRTRGAVSRKGKWAATVTMAAGAALMQFIVDPLWVRIGGPLVMAVVLAWLWSRPEA